MTTLWHASLTQGAWPQSVTWSHSVIPEKCKTNQTNICDTCDLWKSESAVMKYFAAEILILLDIIFLISASSDTAFEEDFVHSFLIKSDKLKKSERLKTAGEEFLVKTAYKVIFM